MLVVLTGSGGGDSVKSSGRHFRPSGVILGFVPLVIVPTFGNLSPFPNKMLLLPLKKILK